jgi:hypothetical protein
MWSAPAGSCRPSLPGIRSAARFAAALLARAVALCVLAYSRVALAASPLDPALAARVRVLDCERVSAADVHDVLAQAPAPRIVLLQGSIPLVTMDPFARFLIAMGYPEERLRNPRDGQFSYNSFANSEKLAGALAFDYERTGMAAMLIGHSQGGMLAIKVLYEFAGAFHDALHVVDPATGAALPRTSIVDPHTGKLRPVVELRVAYAAALATGWLPRLMLGQWNMLSRLRRIPDSVDEFTGFILPHDPVAGNLLGDEPYEPVRRAAVRNVVLPDDYHHLTLPRVAHLADDPAMRAWIDAWSPRAEPAPPAGDTSNLVQAADIWYSVKRQWCRQAQGLLSVPTS